MAAVPFADPPWLRLPSPFYSDSHRHAMQWENEGVVPEHVYKQFGRDNMLAACLPAPLPVKLLHDNGIFTIGPIKIEDFNYTHTSVFLSEMTRCGLAGPTSSIITGLAYGTPPLLEYASREIQSEIVPALLSGDKRICIAITEPDAGSDVAGIQATAIKSQDREYYIVNGSKKWITNGLWADYASTCVRTGGKGGGGLSLLLVPIKNVQGVSVRRMHVSGRKCSGTSFIEFDDVKVPIKYLIGEEGKGMEYIMTNFNHERLSISINVTTQARAALSAAFEYVMNRKAFGSALIQQPVVRNRLARAGAQLETQWAWVESIVYQYSHLSRHEASKQLGGLTALAKANAGMILSECVQCAQLLFGGNGYTQSGKGELVEKIAREVAGARVPGGSEDVMMDLSIRQLLRNYQAEMSQTKL